MMYSRILISFLLVIFIWASLTMGQTCDSCGKECQSACGTRGFRTCCLNYLKKRTETIATDPEMRLPFYKALSSLTQNYPSLRNIMEPRDETSTVKIFIDKPPSDRIKCTEYD